MVPWSHYRRPRAEVPSPLDTIASMRPDAILAELDWRGLYFDCTDREALQRRMAEGPLTLYCGFDPTSDSLHVGNLVPLFALRRFQLAGHHPIALAGGSTGMIGDPSGKSDERNLLTPEQLAHNIAGVKVQLAKFLDFDVRTNPAQIGRASCRESVY